DEGRLMAGRPQTPGGARSAGSRRSTAGQGGGQIPRRRPRPRREPRQRSDLTARILVAIPAIALALFIVIEGGLIFTLAVFILGAICMHELYGMYARARPVRLAGLIALAGLLAAARYGGQFQILLVAVAALPMLFGLTLLQPRPSV